MPNLRDLSRRERQVMEVVYAKASASVEDIRASMPQPASYSSVRVIVNILEKKGYLKHSQEGRKYIYSSTTPRVKTVKGVLENLLSTYFGDSMPQAVAAMVRLRARDLSDEDMRQLIDTIERSRKEGSK